MNSLPPIRGPQSTEAVPVWNESVELQVQIGGEGPPLVYFHPAGGMCWDRFLDALAERYTVHAPVMPGMAPGEPHAIDEVDTFWDLLLLYEEALRKLGLEGVPAVGPSLGGMVALDLAANFTYLFTRVVALAPAGLWRESLGGGIAGLARAAPEAVPGWLFADPSHPEAQEMLALPAGGDAPAARSAASTWAAGAAGKFLRPLPEQGGEKRLHRVEAPALVIWGREDRLLPVGYAAEFQRLLPYCEVAIIDDCGHLPQVEQREAVLERVRAFLEA